MRRWCWTLLVACHPPDVEPTDVEAPDEPTSPEVDTALEDCADVHLVAPGTICTVVGTPEVGKYAPEGLPARESSLYLPVDVTVGPDGLLYVVEFGNHRIRRVERDGTVRNVVGNGYAGAGPEGPAADASLNRPTQVVFDPADANQMYFAHWGNSRVDAVDLAAGTLRTIAGATLGVYNGDGLPARDTGFQKISGLAFDDDGALILIDQHHALVRRVGPDGTVSTIGGTAPAPGPSGYTEVSLGWSGDGGPALRARFNFGSGSRGQPGPGLLRVDRTLYVADKENRVVRAIDLDAGVVRHVAGLGPPADYYPVPTPVMMPGELGLPTDLAVGPDGALYVADALHHCVRQIHPDGAMTAIAGVCGGTPPSGPPPYGDGGPAVEARLLGPYGIDVADGILYIADTQDHTIRAVRL